MGFLGHETVLYDTVMVDIRSYKLVKTHQTVESKEGNNVSMNFS